MEELIDKLEELKDVLDKEEVIVKYLEEKEKILKDRNISSKVLKYQETKNEKLKEEIYNIPSFLEYKKMENEILLLIMELNSKFKDIKKGI